MLYHRAVVVGSERERNAQFPNSKLAATAAVFCHARRRMAVTMTMPTATGEGVSSYFKAKIELSEMAILSATENLRRLEAQRNSLNGRGEDSSPSRSRHEAW